MTELRHIASTACLALAEIADDPTGRTAETLMTGWMGDGKTAGEVAADAVVAEVKALRLDIIEAKKDRASIVAFLSAEAKRYDKEARERSHGEHLSDLLRAYAILCRTLELQIERKDDRLPR